MPVTGDSVLDVPAVSLDLRHVVSWHPISDTHLLVKLDALSEQEDGADDWVGEEFAVRVNTAEFEAAYTAFCT